MDLSSEQLIMYLPLGCRSTDRTQLSWQVNVARHVFFNGSHSFTVLSLDPETR